MLTWDPGPACPVSQSSFISLWGKQTIWLAVINMFDFHMVADRCLYRYSLSSSDTIASRDKLYWVRRHQIPPWSSVYAGIFLRFWDWPNTNSDLLQARTGTATVTPARTAVRTRRNCPGEASRPGWGAWPPWQPSWLCLLPSWSSAPPRPGLAEGSGPSQISPPAPDLDHFWASGSLNQKMMNLPGRWELYFAIFEFLPTLLSTTEHYWALTVDTISIVWFPVKNPADYRRPFVRAASE